MATDTAPKVKLVCDKCGSTEISRDASAQWNEDTQDWELCGLQDNMTCETCGNDGNYIVKEVECGN